MARSKIFIASSGRTLELARQLQAQINSNYCEAELWTEVSLSKTGKSILGMLKDATKEYDFAVVILARDDVMVTNNVEKNSNNVDETRKARDNCVFEAGLFIGVIGETRCLLLSSVKESDLPSDLGGIIHLSFDEPKNLNDPDECKRAIVTIATRIASLVRKPEPMGNRPLSQKRLLEREIYIDEGGELFMDQVVVASVQPLDVGYEAARQVRNNIDNHNVRYIYFFQGNIDGAEKTCQLLQMVLLSNILTNQPDTTNWRSRLEKLKNNQEEIKRSLEQICNYESIKIFFLSTPPALQYCIHNAGSDKAARLYLKRGEEFIEWASGEAAYQFWDEVRVARGALEPDPPQAVFYGVPGFKLNEGTFPSVLRRTVDMYFPGIGQDVLRLCLEGPQTP